MPKARRAILALVAVVLAGCSDDDTFLGGDVGGTLCSGDPPPLASAEPPDLGARPLPQWYDDAKLGIMVHWGPFAIPAWAERTLDPEVIFTDPTHPDYFLTPYGVERFLRHNPYSEWYWNSSAIEGSGAWQHHREVWGEDFAYERFAEMFASGLAAWNPGEWADAFRDAGARYVVLVTKHHDGYVLWPSDVVNPQRSGWQAPRDVVGEISRAVRERCLEMGLYYSGGIDWTFLAPPFATFADALRLTPPGQDYADYVDAHWRELIARYRPSILWNDITAPPLSDPEALFREYLAGVPDGVVNDRWSAPGSGVHRDFATAEFDVLDDTSQKWEAVRGMGRGFGYNQNELPEDYGPPEKFIHLLVDVVARNGNLLLNVGPRADGSLPDEQRAILARLGAWLRVNGEAIYATRPWTRVEGTTREGLAVRFTWQPESNTLHAILLGTPSSTSITIADLSVDVRRARLLGREGQLDATATEGGLRVDFSRQLESAPAYTVALELATPAR